MGVGGDLWAQVEALHNPQNTAGLSKLYTGDAEVIMPDGRYDGVTAIGAYIDASTTGFSDFELKTSALLESDDLVMSEWICRMIHQTDLRVEVQGATVGTYHDYFDLASLASQFGAIRPAESFAPTFQHARLFPPTSQRNRSAGRSSCVAFSPSRRAPLRLGAQVLP